jgi:hypothetical protein
MSSLVKTALCWACWVVALALTFAWPHSVNANFLAGVLFGVYLKSMRWTWR